MANRSIWRTVLAGTLLAILLAPCPAALAALSGPDPHQCCHKSEDGVPQTPSSADCETMCAREQAEQALVVTAPADAGAVDLTPVLACDLSAPAHAAPAPDDTSPPGSADIRLLACTFLI